MSNLSVLQVVEPGVDGAFRHVEGLVRFLKSRDVRVHLAYSSRRGSQALRELVRDIQDAGGDARDLDIGPIPGPADIPAVLKLVHMIRRHRPQVVHAHSSKAGGLVRLLPFAGVSLPTFYTPHAYFGMDGRRSPAVAAFNLAERLLGRIGTTINISADESAFATGRLGISPGRLLISHNPVDPARFTPPSPEEKLQARTRLGLPVDKVLLGSVGRLSGQKNPLLLTRAFAEVARSVPNLVLVHLGQGPLEKEVVDLRRTLAIEHRVHTPPYLDHPALFYQAVDGFLICSNYEAGWPIVVLEAMSCGLPLVVTSAPGMSEIGRAGLSHCWTAPPGDQTALAAAIRAWLSALHHAAPSNHRDYVLAHFTPEKCYGTVLQAYEQRLR